MDMDVERFTREFDQESAHANLSCIEITDRQWSRVVRTKMSVGEYESRRLQRVFGYLRLNNTPHASELTTRPGPGFHQARVIDEVAFEEQMLKFIGLRGHTLP